VASILYIHDNVLYKTMDPFVLPDGVSKTGQAWPHKDILNLLNLIREVFFPRVKYTVRL
jgi:hypothetical protein